MIYIFYILAVVLIWFSYKSFRGGIDYLNYFKKELEKSRSDFSPFATIIAPCRGLDEDLELNLQALLEQDYPEYEVIFIVDDVNDAVVSVIQQLINRLDGKNSEKYRKNIKLVVAAKAVDSSQKVANLREAVLHANERSQTFAFVDSDARPAPNWLRDLITPLENNRVGATTGYRWFISKNPTFASELRNMWNASIASALGQNTQNNFCWGGSMAILRTTFERLDIREKLHGTLSDDFTVTRTMNASGLDIHFVPQALTPSVENCSLSGLFEFTNRQMKITRVYAPKLWLMSFLGSGLFNVVMAAAFLIVLLSSRNSVTVWFALLTLALVSLFSISKSILRLCAAALVLSNHQSELRKQFLYQNVLWLIAPALFFVNCVAALFSHRITWRGTVYEMLSSNKTVIISTKKTSKNNKRKK